MSRITSSAQAALVSLAVMCHRCGHEVTFGESSLKKSRKSGGTESISVFSRSPVDLPLADGDIRASNAELVILAVPSFAVRETARTAAPFLRPETIVANVGRDWKKVAKSGFPR